MSPRTIDDPGRSKPRPPIPARTVEEFPRTPTRWTYSLWLRTFSHVGGVGSPYRYRVQLVPHALSSDAIEGSDHAGDPMPPTGWELVSARTTDEADELILFRRVGVI